MVKLYPFVDKLTGKNLGLAFPLCPYHLPKQKVPEGVDLLAVDADGVKYKCDTCSPQFIWERREILRSPAPA